MSNRITLHALYLIANRYCPSAAFPRLLEQYDSWGPAHEIGHALIEPPERWELDAYGRCGAGQCRCEHEDCHVYELAAMRISHSFMRLIGRVDLITSEINSTDSYVEMTSGIQRRRVTAVLRKHGMQTVATPGITEVRVPDTRSALIAALERRGHVIRPERTPSGRRKARERKRKEEQKEREAVSRRVDEILAEIRADREEAERAGLPAPELPPMHHHTRLRVVHELTRPGRAA